MEGEGAGHAAAFAHPRAWGLEHGSCPTSWDARGADCAAAPVVAASMAFYARALTMAGRSAVARFGTRGEVLSPFREPHRGPTGHPLPLCRPEPPGHCRKTARGVFPQRWGDSGRHLCGKRGTYREQEILKRFTNINLQKIEVRGYFGAMPEGSPGAPPGGTPHPPCSQPTPRA